MNDRAPQFEHVSDTAFVMARIRGRESARTDRLFNDEMTYPLADRRGEELAQASQSHWLTRLLAGPIQSAVSFRTSLRRESVLVLTEGLLLYLQESEVIQLAEQMLSNGVQRWVTDLNSRATLKTMARIWSLQLNQNIQFQFGHECAKDFFASHKWEARQELSVMTHHARFRRTSILSKRNLVQNAWKEVPRAHPSFIRCVGDSRVFAPTVCALTATTFLN